MDAATSFLKSRARLSANPLRAAAACSAVNATLLIVQCRLLAGILNDAVFAAADLPALTARLWPLAAIIVLRAIAVWGGEATAALAAARVRRSVREQMMDRLLALGPIGLANRQSGELATLLVDGVDALDPYYARFLPARATVAILPLCILAVVLPSDWPSGVVLALTAPLIPLFMMLIGRGAERLNQRQWVRLTRLGAHFLEVVQNLTTLKLFDASRREAQAIARMADDYRSATMSVLRVAFLSALALEFFATVSIAVVAVLIGFRLLWGDMPYERGLFVLLLAPDFYLPLRALGSHYHARMEAIAVAERLSDLLDAPLPQPTPPSPPPAGPSRHQTPPDIVFDAVGLTYADGRRGLDGASFRLAPGAVTALVGPSGAGKSSTVALLLGFAAATAGTIRVDGRPLADIGLDDWRRRIAWVPQRPHLFAGSVADNIRLGRPDADRAAVERAARACGADAMISGLPGGFDHRLGEGGIGLSGGQQRMVALARAALVDAPLLILDEATASLDPASERRIGEALARLAVNRTVLVIAHRLETVRAADAIVVLDHGRVAETGDHEGLIGQNSLYAAMLAAGDALLDAL